MLDSASCKTHGLDADLSNLVAGFDTGCSGYFLHRRSRHASLINCLGVALNFAQTPMPTDGCNEVGATSRFCKTTARRLPQAVRRCPARQASLIAHVAKPI